MNAHPVVSYAADPKFIPNPLKYNRVDLGLDMTQEQDWYRHYFYDLMQWFKKNDLSEFGLTDLREDPPQNQIKH
jgi:hypothetical protein